MLARWSSVETNEADQSKFELKRRCQTEALSRPIYIPEAPSVDGSINLRVARANARLRSQPHAHWYILGNRVIGLLIREYIATRRAKFVLSLHNNWETRESD